MPTETNEQTTRTTTIGLTTTAAIGVILAFVATIASYSGLETAGTSAKLIGADNELGFPASAFALVLFAIVLAGVVAELAGAAIPAGWWLAMAPLAAIGVLFEIWTIYLAAFGSAFSLLGLLQLVVMAVVLVLVLMRVPRERANAMLGGALVVAGVIGFFAAFRLAVDEVGTFIDPTVAPTCNFSILVQCGKNLASWQGSLFGFPNPLIGVGGWIAVIMVGIMLLVGLRFARWFWIAFNAGILGALILIIWLIGQSIFALHTLCPWCMTTWAVVIPAFWLVTFRNAKEGVFGSSDRVQQVFRQLYGFVPLITLVSYVVIAIIAQLQLDVLSYL